jgi:hypothetical protein
MVFIFGIYRGAGQNPRRDQNNAVAGQDVTATARCAHFAPAAGGRQ